MRLFIGGVNGISGESFEGDMGSLIRRFQSLSSKQDYLVIPGQLWLDGIATSPGIVKQFVATKMLSPEQQKRQKNESDQRTRTANPVQSMKTASDAESVGTTIEMQMTGKDVVGGIQFQIIPEFDCKRMSFSKLADTVRNNSYLETYLDSAPDDALLADVLQTPAELGLNITDTIYIKNLCTKQEDRNKVLGDLWDECPVEARVGRTVRVQVPDKVGVRARFHVSLKSSQTPLLSFLVRLPRPQNVIELFYQPWAVRFT